MIPALLIYLVASIARIAGRVYAIQAPQKTAAPYLVYLVVNDDRDYTHQGFSGLCETMLQVDCYAATYAEAWLLAAEVTVALEAWPGSDDIQALFRITARDLPEEESKVHHVVLEFRIRHAE